jgi:hypothetical protein
MDDDDVAMMTAKLVAFVEAHPELKDALAMWQVSRSLCELQFPDAIEILARELPEFAGND